MTDTGKHPIPVTGAGGHAGTGQGQGQGQGQGTYATHTTHATSTSPSGGISSSRGGVREQKDAAGEVAQQALDTGKQLYQQACEKCSNWRQYPKLLTCMLLLGSFLLGATSLGLVNKMRGGMGSYVTSHWDRQTADAHHALDVILDHQKHPELYESTQHGVGVISSARDKIMNFVRGIIPGGRKATWTGETGQRMGESMQGGDSGSWLGGGGGGRMMGRDTGYMGGGGGGIESVGQQIYHKAGDVKDELAYRMSGVGDTAKDVGYGIGSKLSNIASSLKDSVVGTGGVGDRAGDYYESGKHQVKRGIQQMGGGYGYSDDDEYRMAKRKIDNVVRQSDRDL